jgi:hypothetical protein
MNNILFKVNVHLIEIKVVESKLLTVQEGKRYGILSQSAIIPFVGTTIRKEYELRQQCHFIFITRRVATPK